MVDTATVRLVVSALVAATVACSGRGRTSADAERPITVLLENDVDSLDARFALSAAGQRVAQLITPGLITFDAKAELTPELAERFRFVDGDARVVEFKLRSNLVFHDGSSLTAEDVVATYQGLLDPALGSPRGAKLHVIARVEAVDEATVRFHLHEPFAPIVSDLSIGIVPAERARLPAAREQERHPIGAGPFRFVRRDVPEEIVLEAHADYFRGRPAIPRLVLRTVRDETTRLLELLKGRADLMVNALSPSNAQVVRDAPGLRLQTAPGTSFAYLGFNLRSGPSADVRVRRALCAALDVSELVEHKYQGLALPATGLLSPGSWAYAPTQPCTRDLAKAAALLDEAGYPDPDGPGGRPRLTLSYKTSTNRIRRSIALVLQKQALEAGIFLDIRSLEFGTFFNDIRRGNFEVTTLQWAAVLEPDLLRGIFHSAHIPSEANHWGGWNRGAYVNPALDPLLEEAARADRDRRRALYAEVQATLARDLPYLPLWHEHAVCVVSTRLEGYDCSPHGFFTPLARAREVRP